MIKTFLSECTVYVCVYITVSTLIQIVGFLSFPFQALVEYPNAKQILEHQAKERYAVLIIMMIMVIETRAPRSEGHRSSGFFSKSKKGHN